jgi:siroheme synthase-like protein
MRPTSQAWPTPQPVPEPGAAAPLYPVSLDVAGRPVLVVGGGAVACRKVSGLLASGAQVTVIANAVGAELAAFLAAQPTPPVTVHTRAFRAGDTAGYRLVISATGYPEVDGAVAADADAAGIWINSADDPPHCTFHLPTVRRAGQVAVAVSTRGTSPALGGWLADRFMTSAGGEVGALAELLAVGRSELQAAGLLTSAVDWRALLDGTLPELVRTGALDDARSLIAAAVAAAIAVDGEAGEEDVEGQLLL